MASSGLTRRAGLESEGFPTGMRLYFLRHATAVDGADDAQRALSPAGRRQARGLARFLRRRSIVFDLAFTSPLVRARQTLSLVLDITNESNSITPQETAALLNETEPDQFADWLIRLPESGHVLLVGHEPSLSERVRWMLGLERAESLALPKGALACVKTADLRTAELKFLVTPKFLGLNA